MPLPSVLRRDGSNGDGREPTFAILESKLAPGHLRPGSVPRTALVDRLCGSSAPVVTVVAPAGYGKTTVLRQWAEQDDRPFAWFSIDDDDNDPAVFVTYLAVAVDRVQPIDARVFAALRANAGIRSVVLPRLGAALFAASPFVLVFDNVHLLRRQESLDMLASLSDHLPVGAQVVLAGRSVRGFPLARLRAHGQLEELGAEALALDEDETAFLLEAAGAHLSEDEVADVGQATEGWAAGVYFASLAITASDGHERAGRPFSGDDRVVRDYLALELLSKLSAPEIRFVTRTAALDQMSGPLCDAVLGETGSAEMLESLEQAGLFVVALDRQGRWYRYHRLCHQMLRRELARREPGAARDVRLKAAAWCEANGLPESALSYADASGDEDYAAALLTNLVMPLYSSRPGRDRRAVAEEVRRRGPEAGSRDLGSRGVHPRGPRSAARGRALGCRRWTWRDQATASRWRDVDRTVDRSAARGHVRGRHRPHARGCRDRDQRARAGQQLAWGTRCSSSGVAHALAGDEGEAELVFADAGEIALRAGANGTASVVLAERSLLALANDDIESAEALLRVARAIVRDARLDGLRDDGAGACGVRALCDPSRGSGWRRRRPGARSWAPLAPDLRASVALRASTPRARPYACRPRRPRRRAGR